MPVETDATMAGSSLRKVGVIGLGYVGRAVRDLLTPHFDVIGWDRCSSVPYPSPELRMCEFAIICVDTPIGPTGEADLGSLYAAVDRVPCSKLVIKSTAPPGTTDSLVRETGKEIAYWPEYLSESMYYNPFFREKIEDIPFVIVGGQSTSRKFLIDTLVPILGPTKHYFQCSAVEAETIKYLSNAYFATKVTLANEFRKMCDALQIDWHTVREGWLLDPRVERMHTAAFDSRPGFSGKCLPKDLQAIIQASKRAGYTPSLLQEVAASNFRMKSNDG